MGTPLGILKGGFDRLRFKSRPPAGLEFFFSGQASGLGGGLTRETETRESGPQIRKVGRRGRA
jgi:hypothetical protein